MYNLALAEHLGCEFWTVDQRLTHAVQSKLSWVTWLGQVSGDGIAETQ